MKHVTYRMARAIAVGIVAIMSSGAAQAETRTLTYATYLPQSFTWVQVDDWFMDEVEARTEGRIKFERNYGGSLLGPVEVFPGVSSGAADLGTGGAVYNTDMLPLAGGLLLPFVTENADAAARAFTDLSLSSGALAQEWKAANLAPSYSLVATENSFWTNKAIETTDDLKGMRIRASGGVAQVLQMLGATPVAMGMGDGVQAFKSGAIDGFSAAPFDVSTLVGLQDIATHAGDAGRLGVYAAVTLAFNLNTWESLSDEDRAVISEVAAGAPAKYLEIADASIAAAIDKIKAAPLLKIVRTSPEVDAEWREKTRETVWNSWIDELEAKGIPARATFDEFRRLVAEKEPNSDYTPGFDRLQAEPN